MSIAFCTSSTWVHSSVVRAADCRSAGPWFKSGCALCTIAKGQCQLSILWKKKQSMCEVFVGFTCSLEALGVSFSDKIFFVTLQLPGLGQHLPPEALWTGQHEVPGTCLASLATVAALHCSPCNPPLLLTGAMQISYMLILNQK